MWITERCFTFVRFVVVGGSRGVLLHDAFFGGLTHDALWWQTITGCYLTWKLDI